MFSPFFYDPLIYLFLYSVSIAGLDLLATAGDAHVTVFHIIRDGGSGCQQCILPDSYRSDQIDIAADEGAILDRRTILVLTVVIDRNDTTAKVQPAADIRIPYIGQMCTLAAGAKGRVLELDEITDPTVFCNGCVIAQMAHRTNGRFRTDTAFHDLTGIDRHLIGNGRISQERVR